MNKDILSVFVKDGVYSLRDVRGNLFVCTECYQGTIGKLVQYKKDGNLYEKTGTSFFLNYFYEGDVKEIFLNRENYDMIGMIGVNFEISEDDDRTYLMRIK